MGWSSKPCGDFSIFLLDALQLVYQVCCSKFYQYSILTLQAIVEIHFSSFFWVGILGVFEPNFKAIGKVYIPYKFVQRRHICVKTKEVFFTSKFFPTIYIFGWLPVKICQHSEKLEIPMPIQLNRSILQSLGRLSSEDCLKP